MINEKLTHRWKRIKLGEMVEVSGGGTPNTKRVEYWDGDIPWLTPTEVSSANGRYVTATSRYITEMGLKNSSAKIMPVGTIMMTSRATIGEAIINRVPMATNQGFINIICRRVDTLFLYYWIKANKELMVSNAHGTTFGEVIKSVFREIEIFLPPLPTQRKIASILSVYDDLIENNTRRIKILEEIAQTTHKEWFVNFRFPGHEKVKMVESELGLIPEGWEVKELRDFGNIITGKTPSTKVKEYYGNSCHL